MLERLAELKGVIEQPDVERGQVTIHFAGSNVTARVSKLASSKTGGGTERLQKDKN